MRTGALVLWLLILVPVVGAQEAATAAADTDSSKASGDTTAVASQETDTAASDQQAAAEDAPADDAEDGSSGQKAEVAGAPLDEQAGKAPGDGAQETASAAVEEAAVEPAQDSATASSATDAGDVTTAVAADTAETADQRDTTVGALLIRTEPSDALVMVDGQPVGSAPVKVDSLAAGKHRLQISAEGYFVKSATVLVRGGAEQQVTLRLVRPGQLTVMSDTGEATVVVNERRKGTTPVTIPDLKPATYEVRVELDGMPPFVAEATIESGANDTLVAQFHRVGQAEVAAKPVPPGRKVRKTPRKKRVAMIVAFAVFGLFASIVLIADGLAE